MSGISCVFAKGYFLYNENITDNAIFKLYRNETTSSVFHCTRSEKDDTNRQHHTCSFNVSDDSANNCTVQQAGPSHIEYIFKHIYQSADCPLSCIILSAVVTLIVLAVVGTVLFILCRKRRRQRESNGNVTELEDLNTEDPTHHQPNGAAHAENTVTCANVGSNRRKPPPFCCVNACAICMVSLIAVSLPSPVNTLPPDETLNITCDIQSDKMYVYVHCNFPIDTVALRRDFNLQYRSKEGEELAIACHWHDGDPDVKCVGSGEFKRTEKTIFRVPLSDVANSREFFCQLSPEKMLSSPCQYFEASNHGGESNTYLLPLTVVFGIISILLTTILTAVFSVYCYLRKKRQRATIPVDKISLLKDVPDSTCVYQSQSQGETEEKASANIEPAKKMHQEHQGTKHKEPIDIDFPQPSIPGATATPQQMTDPMMAAPQRMFSFIPKTADDKEEPLITCIVSTQHGTLVMTDYNNSKVKVVKLNSPYTVTASITLDEAPLGLDLLSDNRVVVIANNKLIYILRIDGEITVQSRVKTARDYLSICVNSDSTLIVGCRKDNEGPARVDMMNHSGHVLRTVIDSNTYTRCSWPAYLCAVSGHVFISDWETNAVLKVEIETGRVVEELKHTDMKCPRQVCVDKADNIYITFVGDKCVLVRSGNGEWRRLLDGRQHSEGYDGPIGVCVTTNGVVVVAWSKRHTDESDEVSRKSLLTGHQMN